jgi:hypothetical protein
MKSGNLPNGFYYCPLRNAVSPKGSRINHMHKIKLAVEVLNLTAIIIPPLD